MWRGILEAYVSSLTWNTTKQHQFNEIYFSIQSSIDHSVGKH